MIANLGKADKVSYEPVHQFLLIAVISLPSLLLLPTVVNSSHAAGWLAILTILV